jgi:MoaA/NifB/PqqE/SkfB family radical SAM enzyme
MGRDVNKALCILPWTHLAAFPEGNVRLCCVATDDVKQDGVPLSLQSDSLEDIWNSPYMRGVRRDMLAGKFVKDCANCYRQEKSLGESLRTINNQRWQAELGPLFDSLLDDSEGQGHTLPEPPIYYQLIPGNACNLKCRMCGPNFSSLIERDEVHSRWVGGAVPVRPPAGGPPAVGSADGAPGASRLPNGPWYRDDAWVRDVLLKNTDKVRDLYFTGGEPLIEKQVEKILDHLIEKGVEGNVLLELNTNATVLKDSMLEKIRRFKEVQIGVSLDAYGPYHEYIRYPARWDAIRRNVERLTEVRSERFHVCAGPVLQVYNALNLVEVLRFFDSMAIPYRIALATYPWFLAVDVLPLRVRQLAAERLRAYVEGLGGDALPYAREHVLSIARHLESVPGSARKDALRNLMLFTNDLDAGRKQSFREVHGELVSLLAESGFTWTDECSPEARPGEAGPEATPIPGPLARLRRWGGGVARRLTRSAAS